MIPTHAYTCRCHLCDRITHPVETCPCHTCRTVMSRVEMTWTHEEKLQIKGLIIIVIIGVLALMFL